jgi:hypothetical protein
VLKGVFERDCAEDVITKRLMAAIEEWQQAGVTNATINRRLGVMRRASRLAAKEDPPRVAHVPTFPRLEERSPRGKFIGREDFAGSTRTCRPTCSRSSSWPISWACAGVSSGRPDSPTSRRTPGPSSGRAYR